MLCCQKIAFWSHFLFVAAFRGNTRFVNKFPEFMKLWPFDGTWRPEWAPYGAHSWITVKFKYV